MDTLASNFLTASQLEMVECRDRLECSGDLPTLTMGERKIMLKLLTLIEFDVATIRLLLK